MATDNTYTAVILHKGKIYRYLIPNSHDLGVILQQCQAYLRAHPGDHLEILCTRLEWLTLEQAQTLIDNSSEKE